MRARVQLADLGIVAIDRQLGFQLLDQIERVTGEADRAPGIEAGKRTSKNDPMPADALAPDRYVPVVGRDAGRSAEGAPEVGAGRDSGGYASRGRFTMKTSPLPARGEKQGLSQPPEGSDLRPAISPFKPGGLTIRVYRKTGLISNGWLRGNLQPAAEPSLTMKNGPERFVRGLSLARGCSSRSGPGITSRFGVVPR